MYFNTDLSEQAQEVIFSRTSAKEDHPSIYFIDMLVTQTIVRKHIGLYLDGKLSYSTRIKEKLSKVYKGIGLFRNLFNKLPRQTTVTIYKTFTRPHLDYADTMCVSQIMKHLLTKLKKHNMIQH